ncbi:MAG: hypothetical protein ABIG84_08480 [archaeon]
MTFLIGLMALNGNPSTRIMLILPIILMYQLTFILFQLECDALYKIQWSIKEKSLRRSVAENTAEKIIRYYKSNQNELVF